MPNPRSVIVVGGGIAGIACALRLAEAGVRVTLLETRKKLGGRATSFQDVRTGLTIDNCQHVALGCCTSYLDFCRRMGVESKIRWQREIFWVEGGGRVSVMKPGPLPAPGHFGVSFLTASFLSVKEKLQVAWAMNAALMTNRAAWADRTFDRWLASAGQPAALISKFWEPIIVSACNLTPARVCAATALHVLQEGFLAHRDAAAVGVAAVPLVELYDPAEETLRQAGGELRLGTGVDWLGPRSVRTGSGEDLSADAVVCALPFERALRIVDASLRENDARFESMSRLTHSPILGVHLTFDRPVMHLHSAVLVGKPTQWLFRKDDQGSQVHAVISAADEWIPLDESQITERVLADVKDCFPASRGATLLSSRPVKEKLATFAPTPEVEAARPEAQGSSGLVLAGDYVRTGWPATMEGAVRSGYQAAAAVLGDDPSRAACPPLKPSVFVRLINPRVNRPVRAG